MSHAHESGGHDHGHSHDVRGGDRKWIVAALSITVTFMVIEIVTGFISGSIALLSDAGHVGTDAAALTLALIAATLAARPASDRLTFGYARAEVLSAQLNGASLLVLAGLLGYAAVGRLFDPPEIEAPLVILVGVTGGLANVAAAWALSRATRRSLNVEGAMAHVLADLFGSVAAVVAGLAVLLADFPLADPIAALVVVVLMIRSGSKLLLSSGRVLMQATPAQLDLDAVRAAVAAQPGVRAVADLRAWELTTGYVAGSLRITAARDADCHRLEHDVEQLLHSRFGFEHAVTQVEHEDGLGHPLAAESR